MIKSLQSKMILVMFVFILLVILFSAFFSVLKMEQVYYRGFVEEMLSTISSFGVYVDELPQASDTKNLKSIPKIVEPNIPEIIKNFNIYFSINNNTRNGAILDEKYDVIYSSDSGEMNKEFISSIINREDVTTKTESYSLINDRDSNEYYFIFFIKDINSDNIKNTIIIGQDKSYINSQMHEVTIFYAASIIVISIITIVISALLASNVTKPIEFIRKKAQLIAARRWYKWDCLRW